VFLGVDMDETFPSIADVFWLAGYPPFFAGLTILLVGYVQSGLPLGSAFKYIVACVVILGIGAFLVVQLLVPILADDTLTPLVSFYYMFYPLADLVLLVPATMLVLITSHFGRGRLARPWMYIAVGFLLMGAADILYSYLDWQGLYGPGHAIDIAWNASYCVIGLAGWHQARLVRSL
jgi:hypothetical protein